MMNLIKDISFRVFVTLITTATLFANSNDNTIEVNFNQSFIEHTNISGININSRDDVLSLVLNSMQDDVVVYPSEGYYYFSFFNNGDEIKGNLRFDVIKRDEGEISFVYYKTIDESKDINFYHTLTKENGVVLKKINTFKYELIFNHLKKIIHIYDAKSELANKPKLADYEEYIGPIFDDAGVRFHLIYDNQSRVFLFVLNDTLGYSESFRSLDKDDYIRIGIRTKFAYYNDKKYKRMVLIGVSEHNVLTNNHYDGPFDQLPDSFLNGEHLKELIENYDPLVKGQLASYGIYKDDESSRYAISPYLEYTAEEKLFVVYQCINKKDKSLLNLCLGKDIYR